MGRPWVWLQLFLGWVPVWALIIGLILTNHPGTQFHAAALIGLRGMAGAVLLGFLVYRFTRSLPWPHPLRAGFIAVHLVAAAVYSAAWLGLTALVDLVRVGPDAAFLVLHAWGPRYLVLGLWLYIMVAGVTYASQAAQRAAHAEALAARSQLAALRAQLNPHFLFNALHTVVQLIPLEPRRAAQAAEQLAGLLRTTIEEDRDLVTLAEERRFVERYLDIERIRFGERLRVTMRATDAADDALLPSFALQTLVENAVRHGAAPRVEPTDIVIEGRLADGRLILSVVDTGAGVRAGSTSSGGGTGLTRLRERLAALYGREAALETGPGTGSGFSATLTIPQTRRA